ncbi:MAG: hypothetical protein WD875_14580 [Pirellulales bacterium]
MNVEHVQQYEDDGWVGIETTIGFSHWEVEPIRVRIEIPSRFRDFLAADSLACQVGALMPAMRYEREIEWDAPVPLPLVRGIREFQAAFSCYFEGFLGRPENLFAAVADDQARRKGRRGVFFSSGLDSMLATYAIASYPGYRRDEDACYLIPIIGMDLESPEIVKSVLARAEAVASDLGWDVMPMRTNLKSIVQKSTDLDWVLHSHGTVLAACALAVRAGFDSIALGSSGRYGQISTEGSMPRTDELWMTQDFQLLHVGAQFSRLDKIREMKDWGAWLPNMRVCFSEKSEVNCGKCGKCVRTMFCLDALGMADVAAASFAPVTFTELPSKVGHLWTNCSAIIPLIAEIAREYERQGRLELVRELDRLHRHLTPSPFRQVLRNLYARITRREPW